MNYFTATISVPLAEKLKEKGMPDIEIIWNPIRGKHYCFKTYAEVFDWMMEKGKRVYITRAKFSAESWNGRINDDVSSKYYTTWQEAAEKAIEKALELIK